MINFPFYESPKHSKKVGSSASGISDACCEIGYADFENIILLTFEVKCVIYINVVEKNLLN